MALATASTSLSTTTWEYQLISTYNTDNETQADMVKKFNDMGALGWEIVPLQTANLFLAKKSKTTIVVQV